MALRVACTLQEGPKAYAKGTLLRYLDSGIVKISRKGAARAIWHCMKCFCMQEDRRRLMLQRWEHTSARTGAARTAARAVSSLPCMCVVPVRRNQAVSNHQAAGKPLLVTGIPSSALAMRQAFLDAFPCLPVCAVCRVAASTGPESCMHHSSCRRSCTASHSVCPRRLKGKLCAGPVLGGRSQGLLGGGVSCVAHISACACTTAC